MKQGQEYKRVDNIFDAFNLSFQAPTSKLVLVLGNKVKKIFDHLY